MDARTAAARFLDSPALSDGTRRAYRVDVGEFCAWLEARGTTLDDVDMRAFVEYASHLGAARPGRRPSKLAPATISRKLAAVRAFLRHALGAARVPDARVAPRRRRRLPETTRGADLDKELARARGRGTAPAAKPRARRARVLGRPAQRRGRRPRPRGRRLRAGARPHPPRQGRQGARRAARRGGGALGLALPARGAPRARRPARTTRCSSPFADIGSTRARCAGSHRTPTACATPSRPTCSKAAPTCARSRSCSGTARSRRRRSTATSTRAACARSTTARIPAARRGLRPPGPNPEGRWTPPSTPSSRFRPRGSRRGRSTRTGATSPTSAAWLDGSPDEVTTDQLAAYIASMRASGLAATTIARRVAALRSFYRHQVLLGARSDNPAAELELPRRARTLAAHALARRGRASDRCCRRHDAARRSATARSSSSSTAPGCASARRSGSSGTASISSSGSFAASARARRSASCRSAARPSRPCAAISHAAGRTSTCATGRSSSSTRAAAG